MRFELPQGHAEVLADPDGPAHVAPFAPMLVGIAGALPDVVDAYRSGAGVPYTRYGADLRDGQGAINRPSYVHDLAGWRPCLGRAGARARARARACGLPTSGAGQGFSTVGIARAYPGAQVVGVDLDEASVADARRAAAAAEVEATFVAGGPEALTGAGPFDLVCIFEALHDVSAPLGALAACRRSLADGGAVLVVDEKVAESFVAPGDQVERMMYGWSVSHCLPACRAEQPSAALGTVLREGTVRQLATEAGFASVDTLAIEHDFFRFYLLRA